MVLAVVALAAMLKAYSRTNGEAPLDVPGATQTASLTVSVEKVRSDSIPSVVIANGSLEPWQEVTIAAEVSGLRLTEVLVKEGDSVTQGAVVARLNSELLKAQLAEQEAVIVEARATLEAAELASHRAQKLLAIKAVSAETAEEKATTVKTSQAKLAQAEAVAQRINAELEQTEVHAPFDGIIASKPAVAGSVVEAGTELMKVIRDGKLEVAVLVPEKSLPSILPGHAAALTDASGRTIEGKVSSIGEKVDSTTRLGTVRVSLGDASGLKSGMFVRVAIETGESRTVSVAQSALVWRSGTASVFVVGEDGKAIARSVETGTRKGGRVAILSGLTQDEYVVIAGAGLLNDGNLVRIGSANAWPDGKAANAEKTP